MYMSDLSPYKITSIESSLERKKPKDDRIRCRCERCGKRIEVMQGYRKLCWLCDADRRRI